MIPIHYDINNDDKIKIFRDLVKADKSKQYLEEINILCITYFNKSFDEIIMAPPKLLVELKEVIDSKSDRTIIVEKFRSIKSRKINDYVAMVLYKNMSTKARKIIFDLAASSVCPYCNRNFIEMVEKNSKGEYIGTFQLDHFFDKCDYPMFAVSAYNLIPVCGSCNLNKLNNKFEFYPYDENISEEDYKFDFSIHNSDFLNNIMSIKIKIEGKGKISTNIQGLYLEALYQRHVDVAQEIIKKIYYYGDGYIESEFTQNCDLFENKAEVYRLLFGNYFENIEFNKRPLSKFTKDIFSEASKYYAPNYDEYRKLLLEEKEV